MLTLPGVALANPLSAAYKPGKAMQLGLVTYLWGKNWDVPTLIANCEKTGLYGVELRTEHAHGVDPGISQAKIDEVRKRFENSKVKLVGLGSNEQYDHPDAARLKKAIEDTKVFVRLSQAVGGSGVKVKPNAFHTDKGISKEQTIAQIGKALHEVGAFASDHGQLIRVEVHGKGTQELPNMKAIMEATDHPNVRLCWNCNDEDLIGGGLEHNFNLVKQYLGDTVHVREMNIGEYPYQQLMSLLTGADYKGWILLECRTDPEDKLAAMNEQKAVFKEMMQKAKG